MDGLLIPDGVSLSPTSVVGRRCTPVFPMSSDRARYYFLCRNGIHHSLRTLGLERGDELLFPSYCHGVELKTLRLSGLEPRFYPVGRDLALDVDEVEGRITSRTRALYVIHYLGWPQPMRDLADVARRHGLDLLEDCALALFSADRNGPLGTTGDVSFFCLYKSLAVPQGGVLVVNRPDLDLPRQAQPPSRVSTLSYALNGLLDHAAIRAGRVGLLCSRLARSAARVVKRAGRIHVEPVDTETVEPDKFDLGMSAFARRVLARVDAVAVVRRRRANYELLDGLLDDRVRRVLADLPAGVCPLSFPIFVRDKPAVRTQLAHAGVGAINMWFFHLPGLEPGRFPDTDFLRRHLLELPVHQELRPRHLRFIGRRVNALARW